MCDTMVGLTQTSLCKSYMLTYSENFKQELAAADKKKALGALVAAPIEVGSLGPQSSNGVVMEGSLR